MIFGAMDTRYDLLSNGGIWLEYHYTVNPGENEFIFTYKGLDDPIRVKERLSSVLEDTLRDTDFNLDMPGLIGTHSIRMMTVTFARGNGCSKVWF